MVSKNTNSRKIDIRNMSFFMFLMVIITILSSGSSYASETIQTRSSEDYLVVTDNEGLVTAEIKRSGNTNQGIMSLSGSDISTSDFRGGFAKSRVQCVDNPNHIYENVDAAKSKYANCFTSNVYNEIERDLLHLMKEKNVKISFFSYVHEVRIQNNSSSNGYEKRYINANVIMKSNDKVGGSRRLGVTVTLSSDSKNIYIKYENSKAVDILGEGVVMPGSGVAKVYTMSGTNPEQSDLSLIESIEGRETDFDANMTDNGSYGTEGVKNLIVQAGKIMDQYSAMYAVIDYGNPISIKTKTDPNDPDYEIAQNVIAPVTDRFYYRNECTGEGVVYGQDTEIKVDIDYRRDRYTINQRSQANSPVNLDSIQSFTDIQASDAQAPVDSIKREFNKTYYGYPYETSFNYFAQRLADPIGKNSSSPNNLFSIGNNDPYNDIPAYAFQQGGISSLRDETIKNVNYYVMVETSPGYYKTETRTFEDIVGYDENNSPIYGTRTEEYQVYVPPVYEQKKRNACVHNTQVNTFCNIYDCQGNKNIKEGEEKEGYYWDVGSWGKCSSNCGTGIQRRAAVCKSSTGGQVSPSNCTSKMPVTERGCTGQGNCGFTWKTGNWSDCSRVCNGGIKTRDVYCESPSGSRVSNSLCEPSSRPASQDICNTGACKYAYTSSEWSSCQSNNQCRDKGLSVGWMDGNYSELKGKFEFGFNQSNFVCENRKSCPGNYRGNQVVSYGFQQRNVSCIRTNDNKEVEVGYCGETQPFTYQRCVRSTRSFCTPEHDGSDGTGGGR